MKDELLRMTKQYIVGALCRDENIFDGFIKLIQTNWDGPCKTIQDIRAGKNTKAKGDLFEHFAYLYFKELYVFGKEHPINVWLLKDAPADVLEYLGLDTGDLGIDIILEFSGRQFAAVQVKYRKPNKYKPVYGIGWKQLATFYALVNRTGPYVKHIVITNAHYVRHVGKKGPKDQTIALKKLHGLSKSDWSSLAGMTGYTLSGTLPEEVVVAAKKPRKKTYRLDPGVEKPSTVDDLRAKRLAYFV